MYGSNLWNDNFVDLTFDAERDTTAEEVNAILKDAADGIVLGYNDEPLVSIDFNHQPASSTFDAIASSKYTWFLNCWKFKRYKAATSKTVIRE